jgi:hypothetical protein
LQNSLSVPDPKAASPRLLLIAPALPPLDRRGGMDVAVANVVAELRQRGWVVDMPLVVGSEPSSGAAAAEAPVAVYVPSAVRPPPPLDLILRSPLRSLIRLPEFLRGYLSLFVDRSTVRKFNGNLLALERVLKTTSRPDAILLFSGYATPGVCAMALVLNPRTVMVSSFEPAFELKLAWAWSLMRRFWSWRLQGHSIRFSTARPRRNRCAASSLPAKAGKRKLSGKGLMRRVRGPSISVYHYRR